MKQALLKLLALTAVITFCTPLYAAPKPSPTPPLKEKPDTITSVSSDSISVEHSKIKLPAKGKEGAKYETSTKTYKITPTTDILISGKASKVNFLKTGMAVIVTADSPSVVSQADKNIDGVATRIAAQPE